METNLKNREAALLSDASPEMMESIRGAASVVKLKPGSTLFSQGEESKTFYIIEEGEIEISVLSPGGRKLTLDIMTPGEILGEIGLFAGRRTATASALGKARLLQVQRAEMMKAMRDHPDLALQLIDLLCERLRTVSEKLEDRSFQALPARLAGHILHLDAKVARQDGKISVSQAELGDFSGATREAVAKTLADWRSRGWVSLSRGSITVADPEALEAIVTGSDA